MKITLFVLGTISIILIISGSFFKMMHWVGGNDMLIFGLGCFVLLFIPVLAVFLYRKSK